MFVPDVTHIRYNDPTDKVENYTAASGWNVEVKRHPDNENKPVFCIPNAPVLEPELVEVEIVKCLRESIKQQLGLEDEELTACTITYPGKDHL